MAEKIIAVVPAHNEEENIGRTVQYLMQCKKAGVVSDVIVVANGCTDSTAFKAKAFGAEVITTPIANKGGAIIIGAKRVHQKKGTIMVMLDADVTGVSPRQIAELARPVALKESPMTLAKFEFSVAPGRFGSIRNTGFRAISMKALNPIIAGNKRWIEDFTTGAYSLEMALNVHLFGKQYAQGETTFPRKALPDVYFTSNRLPRDVNTMSENIASLRAKMFERTSRVLDKLQARKEQQAQRRKMVRRKASN